LVQYGDKLPATGPAPTTPGGWGLRNPESKEPGQRNAFLFAIQQGGRWAEFGRHYDSANDPVTVCLWPDGDFGGFGACEFRPLLAVALLQRRSVGAIMSVR
jgi:hypothetical protein